MTGTEKRSREHEADNSIWRLKPWWCQPWSIVLTGLAVILASWVLLHLWWLTTGAILVIGAWWWLFLVVVPEAHRMEGS